MMKSRDIRRRWAHDPLLAAAALAAAAPIAAAESAQRGESEPDFSVLAFSRTEGFRHGPQIDAGLAMLDDLAAANNFAVDATEDPADFTASNLANYAAVVFLNTSGDVLDPLQQAAFEDFITAGGGFVGIHSAADTEYDWPFYGELVGAYFESHPPVQPANLIVFYPLNHPSTAHLDQVFQHEDEWYNFQVNPYYRPGVTMLVKLDEYSYQGGTMGIPHPISWCHENLGGRSWYTGMGHTVETYSEEFYRQHVLGGIQWVVLGANCPADLDGDGQVASSDLSLLLGSWATSGPADIDNSGVVDTQDLAQLLGSWGPCN